MLELLPEGAPHVVALRVSGLVTTKDLQQAIDAIESKKKVHHKVSLYAEIEDMRWMTFTALLRDLGYSLTQLGELTHYHRVAIVTNSFWIEPLARIENQLFKTIEVKVFSPRDKVAAHEWAKRLPEPVGNRETGAG
jgi:hypothetical protein